MKASDRRDLELMAEIRVAKRAIREAQEAVNEKATELREAKSLLAEKVAYLHELEDEAADGNPDSPLIEQIARNQDSREAETPAEPESPVVTASTNELLDKALLHALTLSVDDHAKAATILNGCNDRELLDELGFWWPERPETFTTLEGVEYTVSTKGEGPKLFLGGMGRDVNLLSNDLLVGSRLAERVRKVLGLTAPVFVEIAEPEPEVIDEVRWTSSDVDKAVDHLVQNTGLIDWWKQLYKMPGDHEVLDQIQDFLSPEKVIVPASQRDSEFGYGYQGGIAPALWMLDPAEGNRMSLVATLDTTEFLVRARNALQRAHPLYRPSPPKPRKPRKAKASIE